MIDTISFNIMSLYEPKFCTECGVQVSDHSRTMLCRKCDSRLKARARMAGYRAAGLCCLCGSELEEGYKRCAACRAKRRQRRQTE